MHRLSPLIVVVAALAIFCAAASSAPTRSTITLVLPGSSLTSKATAGSPTFGSKVTFLVNTSATAMPWVENQCFQGRRLVYSQTHGLFDGYLAAPIFTLGPTPSWTGGSADCTATLFSYDGGKRKNLATTTFTVAD